MARRMATETTVPAKKVAVKKAAEPVEPKMRTRKATPETEVPLDEKHLKPTGIEKDVVRLRQKEGLKWDQVADQLGTTTGRCLLAYLIATYPDSEKIKGSYEKRTAAIPKLREKEMSWAQIAVAVDLPESRVKLEYEKITGVPARGLRVGRGGRYPSDAERPAKAVTAKKAAAPVKQKTVDTGTGQRKLLDLDIDGLKEKLETAKIVIQRGDKQEQVEVKSVTALKNGTLTFVNDVNGASRTVKVADIIRVGKRKVAA